MTSKQTVELFFPHFELNIISNDKNITRLITQQFPKQTQASNTPKRRRGHPAIRVECFRTEYSKLPRSSYDCFHGFTIFYNRFVEYEKKGQQYKDSRICYDVGPRTLRTIIDQPKNTITSYIATPSDFEKDLLFDLIFFQPLKCLLLLHGLYLFHASCVAKDNKGVLFAGKSGSGKTSLALTLLRKGFCFLADDEVILYPQGEKVQCGHFSSRPKIKKQSFCFFPEWRSKTIPGSTKKDKVLIDLKPSGIKSQKNGTATPQLLIFPKFVKSSPTKITVFDKQKALTRLSKEESQEVRFSARGVYEKHFLIYASLLKQVRTYQLFYQDKDLHKIPDMIAELLD